MAASRKTSRPAAARCWAAAATLWGFARLEFGGMDETRAQALFSVALGDLRTTHYLRTHAPLDHRAYVCLRRPFTYSCGRQSRASPSLTHLYTGRRPAGIFHTGVQSFTDSFALKRMPLNGNSFLW